MLTNKLYIYNYEQNDKKRELEKQQRANGNKPNLPKGSGLSLYESILLYIALLGGIISIYEHIIKEFITN